MADYSSPSDAARSKAAPPALDPAAGFDDPMDMTVPWAADDALQLEMEQLQATLGPESQGKPARAAAAGFGKGQDLDPRSGETNAIGYRDPRSVAGQGANGAAPSPLSPYAGLAAAHETEAELDRLRSENAVLS